MVTDICLNHGRGPFHFLSHFGLNLELLSTSSSSSSSFSSSSSSQQSQNTSKILSSSYEKSFELVLVQPIFEFLKNRKLKIFTNNWLFEIFLNIYNKWI
jgi:hypothetical protein